LLQPMFARHDMRTSKLILATAPSSGIPRLGRSLAPGTKLKRANGTAGILVRVGGLFSHVVRVVWMSSQCAGRAIPVASLGELCTGPGIPGGLNPNSLLFNHPHPLLPDRAAWKTRNSEHRRVQTTRAERLAPTGKLARAALWTRAVRRASSRLLSSPLAPLPLCRI